MRLTGKQESEQMEKKEEKEFVELVRHNERVIYKVCTFYVSPPATLGDLYQEVVINLWRAYPRFRGESSPSTWIYRVALNTCISYVRRDKRRGKAVRLNEIPDIPHDTGSEERIKELYRMIEGLNSLEKAIMLLLLEDRSYHEIAEITGLTATNVGVRINRIKNKMKNKQ